MNETLIGLSPGFLCGCRQTLLPQIVDGFLDIIIVLGEGFLTIKNAGPGFLTKFLHELTGSCHDSFFLHIGVENKSIAEPLCTRLMISQRLQNAPPASSLRRRKALIGTPPPRAVLSRGRLQCRHRQFLT